MKITSSLLLSVTLLAVGASNAGAAISLADGVAYTQNFDTLANSGTSSTMPDGWVYVETGSSANTTYTAGTGSGNAGDTYSFGPSGSSDRALGGLQSGSVVPTFGASFTNNVGASTIDITITYTGEQWRLGATGREDRLDFEYSANATSLTTGTWTSYNSLDFVAPVTSGTTGALNGNTSPNRTTGITATITGLSVTVGGTFWIRWKDFNATGADDGLAVDDFSITAVPETSAALLGALGVLGMLRRRR
ncbi:MAG: PEP-CTERM sorting domain-containing protein [Verrucomicrobia bacterium]|nr:PEP-CTERM sorting domain-containing protein [Verrucomicrobiota bacterium]